MTGRGGSTLRGLSRSTCAHAHGPAHRQLGARPAQLMAEAVVPNGCARRRIPSGERARQYLDAPPVRFQQNMRQRFCGFG